MKIALPFIRVTFACILGIAAGCGSNTEKLTLGKPCHLNTDCTDPLACKFSTCHRQCVADRDCDVGQRCVKVDGGGVCQLPAEKTCGSGVTCQAPLACASDGQCRTSCTTQMDCLGSQMCVSGGAAGANVCAEAMDLPGASTDAGSPGGSGGANPTGGAGGNTGGSGGANPTGGAGGSGGTGGSIDGGGADGGGAGGSIDGGSADGGGAGGSIDGAPIDGPTTMGDGPNGGTDGAIDGANGGGYVPPQGPLVVEVTAEADPIVPGGRLRYAVSVGNVSARAVDGVSVLLRVPTAIGFAAGAEAQPASSYCGNGYCSGDEEATWTLGSIAAGTRQVIDIQAYVVPTAADGDSIAAMFKVSGPAIAPISVSKTVKVATKPSAQLVLSAPKDTVKAGETVTLSLDVGQIGLTGLTGTELRLAVPPGLNVAAISDGGSQAMAGADVVWTVGDVPVGTAVHRTVDVTVAAPVPAGALLTTHASLKFDGGADIDAGADHTLAVIPTALPLQVAVSALGDPAVPSGRVLYTVTVSNVSTREVDAVGLWLLIPSGVDFGSVGDAEPDSSYCGNGYCSAAEAATWTLGTLAPGSSRTIHINGYVPPATATDGDLISATIRLDAPEVEVTRSMKTIPVVSKPAAQLVLGTTKGPVAAGESFDWDVDVGQIGPTSLNTVEVRLALPSGLTVGTISDGGSQAASGEIVWPIDHVSVGASVHRQVTVTAASATPPGTVVQGRATLSYEGGSAIDAVAEHAVTVVAAAPPLKIEVAAAPSPVAPNARLLYTMTLTNTSARDLSNVNVLLRTPIGTAFAAAQDADPDSSYCGNGYCSETEEAAWTIASIPAGMARTITVNALVASTVTPGSLVTACTRVDGMGLDTPLVNWTTVATKK